MMKAVAPHLTCLAPKSLLTIQMRWTTSDAYLSVIKMPSVTAQKLERNKRKKRRKETEMRYHQSQQGDINRPVIACRRKEFNHYLGQTYSKFAEIPLASQGWHHKKAAGDHFTIMSHGQNPAFQHLEVEDVGFQSLNLSRSLISQLSKLEFENPTNIQTLAIPQILEGKNTLITAETGNGKTLAFLLPMLQQISKQVASLRGSKLPFNSPLGLVIVPGRELAEQIYKVAVSLSECVGINVGLLVGGRTKRLMLRPQMSHTHLLVATVGALSKLTTVGVYNMDYVRYLTLDEADTLLDDSFNDKVTRYISKFPVQGVGEDEQVIGMSGVQLTLVAATVPRSLGTILDPFVDVKSLVKVSTPYVNRVMPHVPQQFFRLNQKGKTEKLVELAKRDAAAGIPVVIFSNNAKTCDWVSLFLNENNVSCVNLNGAMPAEIRKGRFEQFQCGKVVALSCTDLTSRGLDTIRAGHIINYEFPGYVADYIHRCGRTGRVGSTSPGLITSFVRHLNEIELVQKIEYAARKNEEFHNVNANIKRIINGKMMNVEDLTAP